MSASKVLQQELFGLLHAGLDVGVQLGAELRKGGVDVGRRAAPVVNLGDALFKVDAAFDLAQHLVRRAEHAVEQVELVLQQLQHALVGRVALVQKLMTTTSNRWP
jgi:hypothetical protein